MATEKRRGCGYRKLGGLYLVGEGLAVSCDRLPIKLENCPICGGGIKPALGFTWINPQELFEGNHTISKSLGELGAEFRVASGTEAFPAEDDPRRFKPCGEQDVLCTDLPKEAGLMWVGSKFYTPQTFIDESREMGVSKRIFAIPRKLVLEETWILLGHKAAYYDGQKYSPGVFYTFRPARIEKLVPDDTPEKELEELRKHGIAPVMVPKDDKDHQGTVYQDLRKAKKRVEREGQSLLDTALDTPVGVVA